MTDFTTSCNRRTIKTGQCSCDNRGNRKTQSLCSEKYSSWLFHSWLCVAAILSLATPGMFVNGNCQYPHKWSGSWFQKGVQDPILIYNGTLSSKGVCREISGDKFLIES
ncbi:uncharacterized protein LOC111085058, partial [Limulus polyphemus]|uniref:Uncharacterized protein LOC111085058 n=1 Tax=Limulus polyphemus TaxID=6850 RepID=A0ABM1S2H6_LIMPO